MQKQKTNKKCRNCAQANGKSEIRSKKGQNRFLGVSVISFDPLTFEVLSNFVLQELRVVSHLFLEPVQRFVYSRFNIKIII